MLYALMLIRHLKDNKVYLYDITEIKKKKVTFSTRMTLLSRKPISTINIIVEVGAFANMKIMRWHYFTLYIHCRKNGMNCTEMR